MKRALVTTSIEETWPNRSEQILFLGKWCQVADRKASWESKNYIVSQYHWDDRQKLFNDYKYLQEVYEELLAELTKNLNTFHKVNYSKKYWRLIVGVWLGYFIQMVFDRWSMLIRINFDQEISSIKVIDHPEFVYLPRDLIEFHALHKSDSWNELIYSQILGAMKISVTKIQPGEKYLAKKNTKIKNSVIYIIKNFLIKTYRQSSQFLTRNNEFFFIESYFSMKTLILLQLCLRQFPKIWEPIPAPSIAVNVVDRGWLISQYDTNHDENFLALVRTLIPRHLPLIYLEGYKDAINLLLKSAWPKSPKAIFTSNSYSSDDIFKIWAAEKIESGVPLLIGQHGGHDGMTLWNFMENHQINVADWFLSWGWKDLAPDKIIPVGFFKALNKVKPAVEGNALIVEMCLSRYSQMMSSLPVASGQWQNYFNSQCRFVESLSLKVREKLLIRLFPEDFGHGQMSLWNEKYPDVFVDNGQAPLSKLMSKSRICICTYNATTYIESIFMNYPTIVFWDTDFWELRDGVVPYFELLNTVGVFHESPEAAAAQLDRVWDDVTDWWFSNNVQDARSKFCEQYARNPKSLVKSLCKIFTQVAVRN